MRQCFEQLFAIGDVEEESIVVKAAAADISGAEPAFGIETLALSAVGFVPVAIEDRRSAHKKFTVIRKFEFDDGIGLPTAARCVSGVEGAMTGGVR